MLCGRTGDPKSLYNATGPKRKQFLTVQWFYPQRDPALVICKRVLLVSWGYLGLRWVGANGKVICR